MNLKLIFQKIIKKYNSIPIPAKASIAFTICSFMQKGIALLTTPIFTRILTTEQYGIYSVYQSWYSIVIIFCTLYLNAGAYNTGVMKFVSDKKGFLSALQGLMTTITIGLFIIYIIFHEFWNNLFGLSTLFICAMFIEILFVPAYLLWAAAERFDYKYKNVVAVTLIIAIANPLLGVISVLSTNYKAEARVLSMVFVQVIIGLILYIHNMIEGKKIFSVSYWKFALLFSIPLIPHYLSETILQQADRIMISNMVGASEAAFYSVAYTVSMLMMYISNAINQSFTPFTYRAIQNKRTEKIYSIANALLLLIAGGCVAVIAFGPEIIKIFATEDYYQAIYVIPPVAASVYFMFVYQMFTMVEMYFEKNKYILIISASLAILNIFLNYIFIKKYGFLAAGYTTLFCYVLFAFLHYFVYRKLIATELRHVVLFDSKMIFLISIVMILITILMATIYQFAYIRYGVLIILLCVIFINRNRILNIFVQLKK